ncbi:MAG TPA: multiheme c-type cytochrome, partial [Polyangiaceae bacterium]|nr:multiheme c-type cytochrome [Polyangiaceae bacterium]
AARSNPMTTILQRGLDGPFSGDYPSCALACHAEGEPGIDDGGFATVAERFRLTPADVRRSGFHDLPAPLRRLGGVGCLACHGPGTVAEPGGHAALLRADVCATCHDAPPRYGHVVAWRSSRMARSDVDPRTREGACARCHTTWGFLGEPNRKPSEDAEAAGITCAACHAVHPVRRAAGSVLGATCAGALRRETPVPAVLEAALAPSADESRACLSCHAPEPDGGGPAASAAVLWAGRGGLEPKTGAAMEGAAPHAGVPGGCVGCHRSGPAELGRGAGHAFAARGGDCTSCHAEKNDPALRERALALWSTALHTTTPVAVSNPPHTAPPKIDTSTPRGRALWDLALVVEDPAADRHDAPYARALLDAAERVLSPGALEGRTAR